MPRQYLKKRLPDHQSIRDNRYLAIFGPALHHPKLWHLNRRPVAGGVAIGMFAGLIPGPFQMLCAAIFSVLFRVNLPVAVCTTLYTNPFTIVPLYVLAHRIGVFAMGVESAEIREMEFEFHDRAFTQWLPELIEYMARMGKPLIVGLPLLALMLAVSSYFLVMIAWRLRILHKWHRRRLRG